MSHAEEGKHEIVIVRHGHGDHDEGHHGGVWKIAFADFMTAMMCFFLVMWLINASNEQTKAAVASYFNPVKLVDRNSSAKGLEDAEGGADTGASSARTPNKAEGEPLTGPADEPTDEAGSPPVNADEKRLFSDPYAVLAEIASDTGLRQNVSEKGQGGAQESGPATGASGGEAYRDPFAPDFWSQQVAIPTEADSTAEPQRTERPGDSPTEGAQDAAAQQAASAAPSGANMESAAEPPAMEPEKPAEMALPAEQPPVPTPRAEAQAAKPEPAPDQPPQPSKATIAAADRIRGELAKALLDNEKLKDGIAVVATERGVVISVTDQLDFGMFEIGSAVPQRELVLAMQKIGKAISEQQGVVRIGGFTDSRPYKSKDYDNWRLSAARAQSAYYMLVRGGLDDRRVVEVAGHADREPRNAADPFAAINRRIEILLEIRG